jgi:VCBS repeat protein
MIRIALGFSVLMFATLLALPAVTRSDEPAPALRWKKTIIEKKFRSEGVAIADVNKDGKMDILIGDYWYENPGSAGSEWKLHEIRKPVEIKDGGLASYSECMCCWADDINGDGWVDMISIGFPGKPCFWYENPGNKEGHWKEHIAWYSACNETPTYTDLFGNGKRVLVMGWQLKGKEDQGQMAWFTPGKDPTQLWEMHPISEPSVPPDVVDKKPVPNTGKEIPGTRRFSHGLGVDDINADGRKDVICTGGWWEQPADAATRSQPWTFHPANLGDACADMFAYDIDGDGKRDILSTSAHRYGIWAHLQRPGASHPTFVKQDLFKDLVSETHAVHCVDLNGDGLRDFVTGKRFWSHGKNEPGADKPAILYWFEAKKAKDGTVTFTPHEIDNDSGIGTQFVVADFNGDGLLDIVVSNKKGTFLFEQLPLR